MNPAQDLALFVGAGNLEAPRGLGAQEPEPTLHTLARGAYHRGQCHRDTAQLGLERRFVELEVMLGRGD